MTNLNNAIDSKTLKLMIKEKNKYIKIVEKAQQQGIIEGFKPTEKFLGLLRLDEFMKLDNYIKIDNHYIAIVQYDSLGAVSYVIADEKNYNSTGCDDRRYARITIDIDDTFDRTIQIEHKTNYMFHPNAYHLNNKGGIPAKYKFKHDKDILIGATFYEDGMEIASVERTIQKFDAELESISKIVFDGMQRIKELKEEMQQLETKVGLAIKKGESIKKYRGALITAEKEQHVGCLDTYGVLQRCADYVANVNRLDEAAKNNKADRSI